MSNTYRDSPQSSSISIFKSVEDTFDLLLNREKIAEGIDEGSLRHILCVRFGYCQGEDDEILREVRQDGKAVRHC